MPDRKIQERILGEIKEAKMGKNMKVFLENILKFELDILDQGRPVFKTDYERMLNDIMYK